ncbi:hypothetical protein UMN179_02424 [Gallibacterium anatis UMN179]|uniref:Uncharacterized protein n=1 Tax=Gallibacterium anatis (strain UMN179) TaxID=1005058 RepID=F4H9H8_GALAU|nr:hypothetical protein UMN179_02424 [Gallibacterium anatis UMN179]
MVLFYIVIDFSPTSTTTNARFACALYLRPEGQSFTALFDKIRVFANFALEPFFRYGISIPKQKCFLIRIVNVQIKVIAV